MVTEKVTEEQASTEETTSTTTETTESVKEQPFNDEQEARIQQMLAQATATATEQAKSAGRRELQSEQDRNRNAERRVRFAEGTTKAYEDSFKGLDEETRNSIELARYREMEGVYKNSAQEDSQRQQEAAHYQRMNEGVLVYLDNLGILRDDKRIDWGAGSQDYVEARNRLDASVAKIVTENKKVTEDKMKDDFKVMEAKIRKDLNLDSVDTTTGGGSGGDTDADFKRDWGSGTLPATKENMERARKLERS